MNITQTTEPVLEPLTIAEIKEHSRIETDDDNYYLQELIPAARQYTEKFTNRQLITATYDYTLDRFCNIIELPRPPLQSVTWIKYIDENGSLQTLASSVYDVVTTKILGEIRLAYDENWPNHRDTYNAVQIRYVAGYGDDRTDVPDTIRHAMKMLVSTWYENREAYDSAAFGAANFIQAPFAYEALLANYRIANF
jgi:uncharacterized phiE125 gp8 family phage protein